MISPEAVAVRDQLIEKGLETPTVDNNLSQEQRYERIKKPNDRRHGYLRFKP